MTLRKPGCEERKQSTGSVSGSVIGYYRESLVPNSRVQPLLRDQFGELTSKGSPGVKVGQVRWSLAFQ